ncbi:SMP-30/gluconolactonase/LRE family protein [Marinicaulis aureus]|uniref:SMP-30/gluconolactonase/LRE family protein n=1 Tax=Hyphococcus aureus TaxID=2666033 RepID=A0ABW1L0R0_9PROT
MRLELLLAAIGVGVCACAPSTEPDRTTDQTSVTEETKDPHWTFADGEVFPADRTLQRPEDGVVLSDGRLLIADRAHGLIALSPDGSHRPFGNFAAAGYEYAPPEKNAGPNGVAFEPDGKHVLVADVFTGAIYRVDVAAETTELIYTHDYGVNTVLADTTGAIWFTQSTENNGPDSEERLFAAVDAPFADGALFRLAPDRNGGTRAALKVDGLDFANGFVIDEDRGEIFVAETVGGRINGFTVSFDTGEITERRLVVNILGPDNIEMDEGGQLWVASPIGNEVLLLDPETGAARSVFHPQSDESDALIAEWRRRSETGESLMQLMGPDMWGPMPGLITGVVLTPDGGPVYISGLGDALLKLER